MVGFLLFSVVFFVPEKRDRSIVCEDGRLCSQKVSQRRGFCLCVKCAKINILC